MPLLRALGMFLGGVLGLVLGLVGLAIAVLVVAVIVFGARPHDACLNPHQEAADYTHQLAVDRKAANTATASATLTAYAQLVVANPSCFNSTDKRAAHWWLTTGSSLMG